MIRWLNGSGSFGQLFREEFWIANAEEDVFSVLIVFIDVRYRQRQVSRIRHFSLDALLSIMKNNSYFREGIDEDVLIEAVQTRNYRQIMGESDTPSSYLNALRRIIDLVHSEPEEGEHSLQEKFSIKKYTVGRRKEITNTNTLSTQQIKDLLHKNSVQCDSHVINTSKNAVNHHITISADKSHRNEKVITCTILV